MLASNETLCIQVSRNRGSRQSSCSAVLQWVADIQLVRWIFGCAVPLRFACSTSFLHPGTQLWGTNPPVASSATLFRLACADI